MANVLDPGVVDRYVGERWAELLPVLCDFVRIPNVSPAYDPDWAGHGHMDRAVELVRQWAESQPLEGLEVEVVRLAGRTPVILADLPATDAEAAGLGTVLLYGHVDKQPPMVGWRPGLGPWEPVVQGDLLYGRGAADDGYATFAALTALRAIRAGGGRHARCLALIEASEESGSPDLPAYVDALADRIGPVGLVVCLDSGCGSYDRLWTTTSLRGLVGFDLRVDVLTEGIHSAASGLVPSSFRVLRSLLSRIEDEMTGRLLLPEFHVDIPAERVAQAGQAAALLGPQVGAYPFAGSTRPMVDDPAERLLARTWRPALSVTGLEGAPPPAEAGNVLRPFTAAKVSIRIPPGCDSRLAARAVVDALTADPPCGAQVTVTGGEEADGWDAPRTAPWLDEAIRGASIALTGAPPAALGEGGTIPFMPMLGSRFPDAQFFVVGVLGPGSNAHGPNEFLHLPMARAVTSAVAVVVDAHARPKRT